jgi:hypothetical protein
MNFREMWWDDVDWVILIRDKEKWRAAVITVMNLRVPYDAGKFSRS